MPSEFCFASVISPSRSWRGFLVVVGLIFFMFGASLPSWSKEGAKPPSPSTQITVDSDRMEMFQREGVAVFSGNVRARRGTTLLEANRVKVYQAPSSSKQTGSSQPSSGFSSFEADGKVKITMPTQKITGDRAVFEEKKNLLTVEGSVVVKDATGVLQGQKLEIDLTTQTSRMIGGRVRGQFQRP